MSTLTDTAATGSTSAEPVQLTYREAINAALDDEMSSDASVLLIGEDVGAEGGVFKTNIGLIEKYGPSRVRNAPIAENTFTGVALGMALMGLRPVVEFMFADFMPTAADQIVNQLPKYRFMSAGQLSLPVTIRSICGAGGRFGTQHSATAESWYMGLPGLHVVTAASPGAAYRLLRAAIREPDPVLFYEHKALYGRKGPVPRGDIGEFGRASVVRDGSDVTIVATLAMVERAISAAETLAAKGIDAEVIDLQWLSPIDWETLRTSAQRTRRIIVVEEQVHAAGWGATVISRLTQDGVKWAATPRAISLPDDLPIPYTPDLEDQVLPSVERIVEVALSQA